MKLGGKHAKAYGYSKYVGCEVTVTGKKLTPVLVEVTMKVKDIPFPVSLGVHKEDVDNG